MTAAEAQPDSPGPYDGPTCDHCGSPIVLDTTRGDCCFRITLDYHALQTESARNTARHVVYLRKLVERLTERIVVLEEGTPIVVPESAKFDLDTKSRAREFDRVVEQRKGKG